MKVTFNADKIYKFPDISDSDEDLFVINVWYQVNGTETWILPEFVTYDMSKRQLRMNPGNSKHIGTFNFRIELVDLHRKNPKSRSYPFIIDVKKYSDFQLGLMERNRKKLIKRVRITPISIDYNGFLMLQFDKALFYPTSNMTQQYTDDLLKQFNTSLIPQILIKKAFTEKVYDLRWQVKALTNDTATIKVTFKDPKEVSILTEKDELLFRIDYDRYIRNVPEMNETEKFIFEQSLLRSDFGQYLNEDGNYIEIYEKFIFLTLEKKEYVLEIPRQKISKESLE